MISIKIHVPSQLAPEEKKEEGDRQIAVPKGLIRN